MNGKHLYNEDVGNGLCLVKYKKLCICINPTWQYNLSLIYLCKINNSYGIKNTHPTTSYNSWSTSPIKSSLCNQQTGHSKGCYKDIGRVVGKKRRKIKNGIQIGKYINCLKKWHIVRVLIFKVCHIGYRWFWIFFIKCSKP